jgi:cytokinin dehydrogenase
MAERRWTQADLDGLARATGMSVETEDGARHEASRDFGRLTEGRVTAVVRPKDVEETRRVVQFAYEGSLPLTVRAKGMSQSGQSIPRDGLTVNVCGLAEIEEPDLVQRSIRCGPGVTWRRLLAKLLPLRLAPVVVPLNLDLSVGGTVSAGGFGSTSHHYGPAVANIMTIQVIDGRGTCSWCGSTQNRQVFEVVLGGVGRYGIIAQVELALRLVGSRVRTYFLAYDDLAVMLDDQRLLASVEVAHHLEGFCAATMQGLRKGRSGRREPLVSWTYGVHVSVEYSEGTSPSAAVLSGLRATRQVHVEDDTAEEFAARYDSRFEAMRATGAWELAHPWLECILALPDALEAIPRALELLPPFLGDGHRLTWLAAKDLPASLAFPKHGPYVAFAVVPMGVAPALRAPALNALRAVHDLLLSRGGKRYLSGWLFAPNENDWREHHEANHAILSAAKATLDPKGVFESCLFAV